MQKQGCSSTDLGGCTTTKRVNNFFITWSNIPCVCWMLNSHRRCKEENHWLTNVFCWAWQGLHSEFGWHAWTLEQWPISVRCSCFWSFFLQVDLSLEATKDLKWIDKHPLCLQVYTTPSHEPRRGAVLCEWPPLCGLIICPSITTWFTNITLLA
jgi:hypothetical protein